MKDEGMLFFAVIAAFLFYLIYSKNKQTSAALALQAQQQQLNASKQAQSWSNPNTWLAVPGAVNLGLQGIGSIAQNFNNLFNGVPSSTNSGYYGGAGSGASTASGYYMGN
jgi:sterol desaturase/sphingolipid hydroxylase (fatty acid hydroxylase superfamily)